MVISRLRIRLLGFLRAEEAIRDTSIGGFLEAGHEGYTPHSPNSFSFTDVNSDLHFNCKVFQSKVTSLEFSNFLTDEREYCETFEIHQKQQWFMYYSPLKKRNGRCNQQHPKMVDVCLVKCGTVGCVFILMGCGTFVLHCSTWQTKCGEILLSFYSK